MATNGHFTLKMLAKRVRFELTGLSSSDFQVWVRALADVRQCWFHARITTAAQGRDRLRSPLLLPAFAAFEEAGSWRASVYALGTTD